MKISIDINLLDNKPTLRSHKNVMIDGEREEEEVKSGPMFIDGDGHQSDKEIPKEGQVPKMMNKRGEFLRRLRSRDATLLELDGQEVG